MPDEDDRFSDVAEQLKQTESETDHAKESIGTGSSEDETSEASDSVKSDEESTDSTDTDDPPFSFDETDMRGFYVRDTTWNQITRMRSSVTAVCSMFDLPEFEGREFQDACLQVVAEHGDEVALRILSERGIEADEDRVQEIIDMLETESRD